MCLGGKDKIMNVDQQIDFFSEKQVEVLQGFR